MAHADELAAVLCRQTFRATRIGRELFHHAKVGYLRLLLMRHEVVTPVILVVEISSWFGLDNWFSLGYCQGCDSLDRLARLLGGYPPGLGGLPPVTFLNQWLRFARCP